MASLSAFMSARLWVPFNPMVLATDAMGANEVDHGGWGIAATLASKEDLEQLFDVAGSPGYTVIRPDGDVSRLRDPNKELRRAIPCSFVPQHFTDESVTTWTPLRSGRWAWGDHITLGEGRACLKGLDGLMCDPANHHTRVFSLMDNRPWSGAAAKGRSQSPAVNYLCRRRAALCLGTGAQLLLPWTETSRMPADWLSRLL